MNKILFVVVVYNQSLVKSKSLSKILGEYDIAIFDNSTNIEIQKDNCLLSSVHDNCSYYTLGENVGLSKAYNHVINKSISLYEWFITLDQDTELSDEYLHFLNKLDKNINIYCPMIYSNKKLISPIIRPTFSTKLLKSNDRINNRRYRIINSGLIINSRVFSKIVYNESLFLDMIDHHFIESYFNFYSDIVICEGNLLQNFSCDEYNYISESTRLKIFKKDLREFYKASDFLYYFIYLKRYIKLTVKYRKIFDF